MRGHVANACKRGRVRINPHPSKNRARIRHIFWLSVARETIHLYVPLSLISTWTSHSRARSLSLSLSLSFTRFRMHTRKLSLSLIMCLCLCVYVCVCMCVFLYGYIREKGKTLCKIDDAGERGECEQGVRLLVSARSFCERIKSPRIYEGMFCSRIHGETWPRKVIPVIREVVRGIWNAISLGSDSCDVRFS